MSEKNFEVNIGQSFENSPDEIRQVVEGELMPDELQAETVAPMASETIAQKIDVDRIVADKRIAELKDELIDLTNEPPEIIDLTQEP
ncbi:MAG: hypothetical protein K0S38_220 [Candidatus Paceibacter sp.]|jgi:hypothetical protein|nr:hypothetical protein [Candidatus Paceibacter sp.]